MRFLEMLADRILAEHPENLHRVEVIFPAVRPVTPFLRTLATRMSGPGLAPKCWALEDWLFADSGRQRASRMQLQCLLYEAYARAARGEGQTPDAPEHFLSWANGLLEDLDQVDEYEVDASRIFRYLTQQKALEIWSPDGGSPSVAESEYLRFYGLLEAVYLEMHQRLEEQGLAYPGWALRYWTPPHRYREGRVDRVYVAGMEQSSPGLIRVLTALQEQVPVVWICEADAHYLNNPVHLAGHWLRNLPTDPPFGLEVLTGERLRQAQVRIALQKCSGNNEQILAGLDQIRSWLDRGIPPEQIGWILTDPVALWPLLLHWNLPGVSLHLGMPLDLRWTGAYGWMQAGLDLHQALCFKGQVGTEEWEAWLKHPLWAGNLTPWSPSRPGLRYRSQLQSPQTTLGSSPPCPVLAPALDAASVFQHLAHLALILGQATPETEDLPSGRNEMECQALRSLHQLVLQMAPLVPPSEHPWQVWGKMWQQHLGLAALNPKANPGPGIRVLSLELSQALDFEYLVLGGANEGTLPKVGRYFGMLSFDLRRSFGLPEPWASEAIQSYRFYRLLQHSQEVLLTCNLSGADGKISEKSRFVQQLEWEYGVPIQEQTRQLAPISFKPLPEEIVIHKTPEVLERIRAVLSEDRLSPSNLSLLWWCPLKFWFGFVRKLKEPEPVTEELNPAQIGELLHKALELAYADAVGEWISPEALQRIRSKLDQSWQGAIKQCFPQHDFDQGVNVLTARMGKQFLEEYLTGELERVPHGRLRLMGQELSAVTTLDYHGLNLTFKGKMDRLEDLGNMRRIVDFKSGMLHHDGKELQLQNLESCFDGDHNKAFQLLCYAWIFHRETAQTGFVLPAQGAILPLQQARNGPVCLGLPSSEPNEAPAHENLITEAHLEAFEDLLLERLGAFLDPEQPILQTSDTKRCAYCPYNRFCQRTDEE